MNAHTQGVDIRVLGDLTIDGGRLTPKERSLLAALVLRSGDLVAPSELADAIWGDGLPATWPKQVQALVARLRRALGASAVATKPAGYRLEVDPETIDAIRFERLLTAASTHRFGGDPVRAVDVLERALSLWHGAPYADLGEWPKAVAEAERLEEIRKAAEEDLLTARLESGEHRAVIPDAERLVRTDPLREGRWVILAMALYRAGRQADALAALRSARTRLDEELGIAPGAELIAVESGILRQDAALDAPPPSPSSNAGCPYRGLQPFGEDEADEFFGREDDVRAALARLARSPFLAVSGPSGCGKSSIVLAGIVPQLRGRGETVVVVGSGAAPVVSFVDALSERSGADCVVIDQFEELFHSRLPASTIEERCRLIAEATNAGRRVIIAVRSDFLDDCTTQPSLGPLFAEGVHLVAPLGPTGLRKAIEEPAKLAGLRLEPGLIELILRDAAGAPGVLPYVSHTLVETWLRREGGTLTVAGYEESGAISGAIAQSADHLYRSFDGGQQEICRSTFLRLVEMGTDGAPMRRRISLTPLRDDAAHDRVLSALTQSRLVSVEEDTLVIAHESLALAWPRLRGWLESDAEGMRTMHALANAAATWEADGRRDEDLYRGVRLAAALEWRTSRTPELTGSESAFLDESARLHRSTLEEIDARALEERRQNRRLRTSLTAALGLFLVAVLAGGFVLVGAAETERQRADAQIEALTRTAESTRGTEPGLSALLAVEAHRRWPDDARTRSALMGSMTGSVGLVETSYVPGVGEMIGALIPGTREAVLVTSAPDARIVDIDSMETLRTLAIPRTGAQALNSRLGPAVSLDGARVAVAEWFLRGASAPLVNEGRLVVADLATGERLLGPLRLEFDINALALSPDGRLVAAIDTVGELRLIDAVDGTMRSVPGMPTHRAQLNADRGGSLAFTPNGRLLYGNMAGQLLVVDPVTATIAATVAMSPEATNVSMTVLSDSRVVTTGDRRIASVDLARAHVDWSHAFATDEDEPCPWLTTSVALGTLYCGDLHGRIEERSLTTGLPTGAHYDPRLGHVGPIAVTSDGNEIVAAGRGSPTITRWMLDGSGAASRIIAPGWTLVEGYSVDDSQIVVGRRTDGADPESSPTEIAVMDTASGQVRARLPIPSRAVVWVGRDILFGQIGDPQRGFLDLGTGTKRSGGAMPSDLLSTFLDSSGTRVFAVRANGEIWTIDPASGTRIEPTIHTDGQVWSVSSSADDSEVFVTAFRRTKGNTYWTSVFDGRTGEELRTGLEDVPWTTLSAQGDIISTRENRIVRHSGSSFSLLDTLPAVPGELKAVSVSADGGTLIAFSPEDTIAIYDLAAGIPIGAPFAVESDLGVLRADGEELAVDARGGVAVWDLRPATHQAAACRMAGRDLTRDEWAAHLGELGEYRSTCGFGEE